VSPPGRRAAFVDRDGVLNQDLGYVGRVEDFHWLPGAIDALRRLQDTGRALVVITNQSGIARGYYSEADFEHLSAHMRRELEAHGVRLDAIEHCPHLPDAPVAAYRRDCDCRKPAPGMILRAARRLGIDLGESWLFGDKPGDIAAGRAAGVGRCWLIGSDSADPDADGAYASLAQAVDALLAAPQPAAPAVGDRPDADESPAAARDRRGRRT
jgi:D-glycero-D-manno-heptose 1,7-bisphosphate phosphatase